MMDENHRRRNVMLLDIKSMIKDYKGKANYSQIVEEQQQLSESQNYLHDHSSDYSM